MQAPTPEFEIFENSESFQLEDNQNKENLFTISHNSKSIKLKIEDLSSFPKNEYILITSLVDLQKINRFFVFFQNTQETCQTLIKFAKNKNLNIVQENNICKIKIINQINGEEFSLEIPKKEKDIKQLVETFIPLMNEMKNRIEILENENKDLKQKISKLEKKMKKLKKD